VYVRMYKLCPKTNGTEIRKNRFVRNGSSSFSNVRLIEQAPVPPTGTRPRMVLPDDYSTISPGPRIEWANNTRRPRFGDDGPRRRENSDTPDGTGDMSDCVNTNDQLVITIAANIVVNVVGGLDRSAANVSKTTYVADCDDYFVSLIGAPKKHTDFVGLVRSPPISRNGYVVRR